MAIEVQEPCTYRSVATDVVGAPCPNCGHSNLIHANPQNRDVISCPVCDQIIATQQLYAIMTEIGEAITKMTGTVVVPIIHRPPPLPPLRCRWIADSGARCKRAINHQGGHAYPSNAEEPRPYHWNSGSYPYGKNSGEERVKAFR